MSESVGYLDEINGPVPVSSSAPLPVTVTGARKQTALSIPSGGTVSPAFSLAGTSLVGFFAPPAWTAAALQIQASIDGVNNWGPITDQYGVAVSSWSALTALYPYSVDPVAMLPWSYIRLLSGTVGSPVAQGADRVFTMITRPLA